MTTPRPTQTAVSYDAVSILGFGPESTEALPEAKPGETILRYGGWSLRELRDAMVPRGLMHNQGWYEKYAWASEQLLSGIYVLRLPIPQSNCKSYDEQWQLLLPGEEPVPVVLAATALLAIQVSGSPGPLRDGFTRCKERPGDVGRVALNWYDRRLLACYDRGDSRHGNVWLSAARKIG